MARGASDIRTIWSRSRSKGPNGAGSRGQRDLRSQATPAALLSKQYNTTKKMKTETAPHGVKPESTCKPAPHEHSESDGRQGMQTPAEALRRLGLWEAAVTGRWWRLRGETEVVEGTQEPAHIISRTSQSQRQRRGRVGTVGFPKRQQLSFSE